MRGRYRLLSTRGLRLGLHSMLAPTDQTFYQRYGDGLASFPAVARALQPSDDSATGNYYWHKDMATLAAAAAAATATSPIKRRPGRPRKNAVTAVAAAAAAAVSTNSMVRAGPAAALAALADAAPRRALVRAAATA